MKLFGILLASTQAADEISCFTCVGKSWADCRNNGSAQKCLPNETACQVHERKRDGAVYRVNFIVLQVNKFFN